MAETIGVRELKNQTSRIIRAVREEMTEYVVTLQGKPVATLRPFTGDDAEQFRQAELEEAVEEMKSLADKISAAWTSSKSGVELIEEQRR